MSKLGYIYSSYGKQFNIGIANTYGVNVLSGSNLPKNSIIISSPLDKSENDIGIYSLFAVDDEGKAVRLTYTLQEGNGIKYENDTIRLSIDENYLSSTYNILSSNISYLLDLNTIEINNNRLSINVDSLDKISSNNIGVFKIDNNTVKISGDTIYIDTSSLDKANNISEINGIGIGDGKTIFANNGEFSVDIDGLDNVTENSPGLVFTTSNKINIEDGIISISTENLDKSSTNNYGTCTPDGNTIISNDGVLSVNTSNLTKGDSSNYGIIKYNEESIQSNNESIEVKEYDNLFNSVDTIQDSIEEINQNIDDIKYLLDNYGFGVQKPLIFKFYCATLLSGVLEYPEYKEDPEEMPTQLINVEFIINTNCPFNISIEFIDNVEPQITLYEINYGDIVINQGNAGLSIHYQTTEEKDIPLKFSFLCKNYFSDDDKEYSSNTNINIRVSYDNDATVYREVIYTIVRFNSNYTDSINLTENYSDYIANKDISDNDEGEIEDTEFVISSSPINFTQFPIEARIAVTGNENREVIWYSASSSGELLDELDDGEELTVYDENNNIVNNVKAIFNNGIITLNKSE